MPQNPILIIKAPIVFPKISGLRHSGVRVWGLGKRGPESAYNCYQYNFDGDNKQKDIEDGSPKPKPLSVAFRCTEFRVDGINPALP